MGKTVTGLAGSAVATVMAMGGWVALVGGAVALAVLVGTFTLVVYTVTRRGADEPYVRLRELIAAWRGPRQGPSP